MAFDTLNNNPQNSQLPITAMIARAQSDPRRLIDRRPELRDAMDEALEKLSAQAEIARIALSVGDDRAAIRSIRNSAACVRFLGQVGAWLDLTNKAAADMGIARKRGG